MPQNKLPQPARMNWRRQWLYQLDARGLGRSPGRQADFNQRNAYTRAKMRSLIRRFCRRRDSRCVILVNTIFWNIAWHIWTIQSVWATRLTCCLHASRFSACSLHISFELRPVHSFTSSNHLQTFLLIFPLNCTLQDGVPFALSRVITCPNNLNFLSSSVSYFPMCSPTL